MLKSWTFLKASFLLLDDENSLHIRCINYWIYMVCKCFLYVTFTLLPFYVEASELDAMLLGLFCFQFLYFSYIWKWKQNLKMYYSNQSHEDFFHCFLLEFWWLRSNVGIFKITDIVWGKGYGLLFFLWTSSLFKMSCETNYYFPRLCSCHLDQKSVDYIPMGLFMGFFPFHIVVFLVWGEVNLN